MSVFVCDRLHVSEGPDSVVMFGTNNLLLILLIPSFSFFFQSDSFPKPHEFTTGMKLEAVNPKDPSSICAATVSQVANEIFFQVEIDSMIDCRSRDKPVIWCSSNSKNIFPVEWCKKNNIQLTPPPGI